MIFDASEHVSARAREILGRFAPRRSIIFAQSGFTYVHNRPVKLMTPSYLTSTRTHRR